MFFIVEMLKNSLYMLRNIFYINEIGAEIAKSSRSFIFTEVGLNFLSTHFIEDYSVYLCINLNFISTCYIYRYIEKLLIILY